MFRRVVGHIRRQPVAFVALFFALGGAAVAGTGYLKASDKITNGDLAGSTYGNPVIAAHKVTNKKLQHASLSVATDGSTLNGGGPIKLGGSNSTPLGVADGGITNTKLANSSLTLTAGTGLTGGGSIALGGSGSLSVDPTAVQNRVSGTCSSGSAISSINQNGTVGCQSTPPDAWANASTASVGLAVPPGSETTVASKMLPAGSYAINAKTTLDNTAATARQVQCDLNPGGDISYTHLAATGTGGDYEATALQETITLASTTTVVLECFAASGNANEVQASYRALTAIQVTTIH